MPTIITVHGTRATGPEEGERWWQKSSAFEADVSKFVSAEDRTLQFLPFIWDSRNSETSRRRAGRQLFQTIQNLERERVSYCVIGHSHRGSTIAHAIAQSAVRRRALEYLSRWITVATPFIHLRKIGFLFFRLALIGKAAYLTFFAFLIVPHGPSR
jgi:triacylglycerol esterase/lipase EstA (alpha/beta hydrolase family)